jgi:hypothetical protein
MAVVPRKKKEPATGGDEKAISKFIEQAGKTQEPDVEEKDDKKTPVLIYFDPDTLRRIDDLARKKGMSRSAWVRSRSISALKREEKKENME